jgi:hypothetical protein
MPRSMAMRWSEIYTSLEKPQVEMPCFSWPNGLVNWLVNICLFWALSCGACCDTQLESFTQFAVSKHMEWHGFMGMEHWNFGLTNSLDGWTFYPTISNNSQDLTSTAEGVALETLRLGASARKAGTAVVVGTSKAGNSNEVFVFLSWLVVESNVIFQFLRWSQESTFQLGSTMKAKSWAFWMLNQNGE